MDYFYYWYDEKTWKLEYTDGRPPEIKKGYQEKSYIAIDLTDAQCRHFDSLDDMGDEASVIVSATFGHLQYSSLELYTLKPCPI